MGQSPMEPAYLAAILGLPQAGLDAPSDIHANEIDTIKIILKIVSLKKQNLFVKLNSVFISK